MFSKYGKLKCFCVFTPHPAHDQVLNRAAENWYTYRSLVTQRLEVVAQTLHERNFDALIDDHEVSCAILGSAV